MWDRGLSVQLKRFHLWEVVGISSTSQKSTMLHMSSNEGGRLLEAYITKALKQPRSLPVDVMREVEQIQSFNGALANMIDEKSPAASNINTWIHHMFSHLSVYESRMEAIKYFLAMTLFIIDFTDQTHLQSCLVCEDLAKVDVACLNLSAAQTAVLNYTTYVNLLELLSV
jgi:hypothetical protein